MRLLLRHIILITISISLFACSTNVKLIDKRWTKYGDIKFYSEKISKNNSSVKRIYASVKTGDNQSYYSFYPVKIVKTSDSAKTLIYTVFYGQLQTTYDRNIYQRFSFLDSIVLTKGDDLLDSLGLHNFKTSEGAEGFQIEVNYYHGWPKHKKFRP
jgi:hypothetical protein